MRELQTKSLRILLILRNSKPSSGEYQLPLQVQAAQTLRIYAWRLAVFLMTCLLSFIVPIAVLILVTKWGSALITVLICVLAIILLWRITILWRITAVDRREKRFRMASNLRPHAKLSGANLSRWHLRNFDLHGADLSHANLKYSILDGADLTDANLMQTDLTGAILKGANVTRADLTKANLTKANLTKANLTEANLTKANLTKADFSYADLGGAQVTVQQLAQVASLKGAKMPTLLGGAK